MKPSFSTRFVRQLESFSLIIQKKFQKQLAYLLVDLRHPSLRAKKYDEAGGIWQARVDNYIRFYFLIEGESCVLLEIKKHPK